MSNVQEALKAAIESLESAENIINEISIVMVKLGVSAEKIGLGRESKLMPVARQCKAALAEIEKYEPVAYMNPNAKDTLSMLHWAKSEYYSQPLYAFQTISNVEPIVWMTNREDVIEQFGTMTITNAHKNSLVLAEQIIADLFDIPLYTSPQPREWVGLTYRQKVNLREENDWYNFPNDLIEATEAKLKQQNTKG